MNPAETDPLSVFSPDYACARDRFRVASASAGGELEAHPIQARGPGGMELTVDVARFGPADADRLLVISSGLHGVEGFFGSAVQLAWLGREGAGRGLDAGEAVLLVHGLDPFGFAWLRRFDESNVDLNRNFPREGGSCTGCHPLYGRLDGLLNPRHGPRPFGPAVFRARAAATVLRHGLPALKAAIACGQYEYPYGLFFGGHAPSAVRRIVEANMGRWLGAARTVVHLDVHTGLGRWGEYCLLLEPGLTTGFLAWLRTTFGTERVESADPSGTAYPTHGDFGSWCRASFPGRSYHFACAEFGTYPAVRVLGALREENQAHHWLPQGHPARDRAKRRLLEAFVPADRTWRASTVTRALTVLDKVREYR